MIAKIFLGYIFSPGSAGSGKTTYARKLELELPGVTFTLDEWMLRLHGLSYDDPRYPALAQACKCLIWDTAHQVLTTGVDVILDWNQWSRARRSEWGSRAIEQGYRPVIHYIRDRALPACAPTEGPPPRRGCQRAR